VITLKRARQLLQVQADLDGFYEANSCKLILSGFMKEHERQAADGLIIGLKLDQIFGYTAGTRFEGGLALDPLQNQH
jgi:hypothetical protein